MLPATKKEENELKLSTESTKGKTISEIATFKYVSLKKYEFMRNVLAFGTGWNEKCSKSIGILRKIEIQLHKYIYNPL